MKTLSLCLGFILFLVAVGKAHWKSLFLKRVCVAIVSKYFQSNKSTRIKGAKVHRANDLSCTRYTINITVGYCLYYYYYIAVALLSKEQSSTCVEHNEQEPP